MYLVLYYISHYNIFIYLGTSIDCSNLNHITQPILNEDVGQWTGGFWSNGKFFPSNETSNEIKRILFRFDIINDSMIDDNIPVFTVNIFDSVNINMASKMFEETTKDTYFNGASPFITSIFRMNRYFLGRNIVNNNDYIFYNSNDYYFINNCN